MDTTIQSIYLCWVSCSIADITPAQFASCSMTVIDACTNMCIGSTCESPRNGELVAGDKVKVELEFELLKLMQEGHGGWNDFMVAVSVVWQTIFST